MEEVMVIVEKIIDSFMQSGEASNREEAKELTIELIKKHFNKE